MVSIGSILKKEREKKKLSLAAVAEETKINVRYLKAIENDNYTIFPGETYLIGFIRNYSRALGMDPIEVVSLYKSVKIQTPAFESRQSEKLEEDDEDITLQSIEEKSLKLDNSNLKSRQRTHKKMDSTQPIEVIEIKEKELKPKKSRRTITKPEEEKKDVPLSPIPIKERKFFINPMIIGIGAGGILLLVALILLIANIVSSINKSEKKAIYTELSEIKYLEFNDKVLKYDFANSEYYKIKIADKFHTIMFEKFSPVVDAKAGQNELEQQNDNNNIVFHFDDIVLQFQNNAKDSIDFDLDGEKDLEISVNGINQDLISANIAKLHPFIVAKTTNTNVSQTNIKSGTEVKAGISSKKPAGTEMKNRKIVFEAIVKERTYIKAFLDGKENDGKIYYPKDKVYLEAKDVMQLKIGNAGGIVVQINGKKYSIGKRGEIANKVIKWEKDPYDESAYNLVIKDWQ